MWYIGQTWEAWTLVWVLWERERCRYACVRELLILCCSTRGSEDPTKLLTKHLFHKVKHWRLCYEDMLNMCRIANVLKIKFLCHVAEKGSQFHETQSPLRQTKTGGPMSYATSSSIRVLWRWRRRFENVTYCHPHASHSSVRRRVSWCHIGFSSPQNRNQYVLRSLS